MNQSNPQPQNLRETVIEVFNQIEIFMVRYLVDKAPAFPDKAKEWLVKYQPVLMIVFAIFFQIPSLLVLLGLGVLASTVAPVSGVMTIFYFLFCVATLVMEFMAFRPLVKRQIRGWRLLFWADLANVIVMLLNVSLFGLLLIAFLLYVLFQIREKYSENGLLQASSDTPVE